MWTAMRIVIISKRTLGLKENQLVDRMKAWLILERGREPLNGIFSSLEEEIEDLFLPEVPSSDNQKADASYFLAKVLASNKMHRDQRYACTNNAKHMTTVL